MLSLTVRALLCRELAGLSWNGLYERLSTEDRAVRFGFDPAKFGPYNTAPTRQTLTTAWDIHLSDETKRALLSVSERLVAAAYENETTLDLRQPRHVDETDSPCDSTQRSGSVRPSSHESDVNHRITGDTISTRVVFNK